MNQYCHYLFLMNFNQHFLFVVFSFDIFVQSYSIYQISMPQKYESEDVSLWVCSRFINGPTSTPTLEKKSGLNSIFKLITYTFIKSSLTIEKIQRSLNMLD
jgi:hypothetical protein